MSKKLVYFISFVLVVGLTGIANADIESDLVAWWAFNDGSGNTAADSSGNGIHGTLKPGQPNGPTWVAGKIDDALEFNNDNQNYVECGPHPALDVTGSITIAAWVKRGAWDDNYRYDIIIWKTETAEASRAFRLSRDSWDDEACFTLNATGGEVKARGATKINDNQWHHIAGVYDMDTGDVFLYVDGDVDASGSTSGNIKDSTGTPLYIGAGWDTIGDFWEGLIDEVRIYSRALSLEDVMELYESRELPTSPTNASNPAPADGAIDVPACVVLSWTPGGFADKQRCIFRHQF